jgi:uncharacterized protein YyaL (SSP411 family)
MAMNLYLLGEYFYNTEYTRISKQMLNNVKPDLFRHAGYFANWNSLLAYFIDSPYEIAVVGDECLEIRKQLDKHYLPNAIFMGGKAGGTLPLMKDKLVPGQTTIYVCKDKTCRLPVTDAESALRQLK